MGGQNHDVLVAAPLGDAGRLPRELRGAERRVTGTKVGLLRVYSNEERRMAASMPRERDEQEPSIRCDIMGTGEWADCWTSKVDHPRSKPAGPSLRKVAAQAAAQPLCRLPFGPRHNYFRISKRAESSHMIGMQMREDDPPDVFDVEARRRDLNCRLVARPELEARQPEKRVPAREITLRRGSVGLARIDEAQASGVLDKEDIDWQRFVTPVGGEVAPHPMVAALAANPTGREDSDPHS